MQPFWGLGDSPIPSIIGLMISSSSQPFIDVPSIPIIQETL